MDSISSAVLLLWRALKPPVNCPLVEIHSLYPFLHCKGHIYFSQCMQEVFSKRKKSIFN